MYSVLYIHEARLHQHVVVGGEHHVRVLETLFGSAIDHGVPLGCCEHAVRNGKQVLASYVSLAHHAMLLLTTNIQKWPLTTVTRSLSSTRGCDWSSYG